MILAFTACLPGKTIGQTCLKGTVADAASGSPVASASVALYQNKTMLQQTQTDSLGKFRLCDSVSRNVMVSISMVGYHTLKIKPGISATGDTIDLGMIQIVSDTVHLKTIVIRGQKPLVEQRMDGIVFNAENLVVTAGSDAADVLRNVPLVQVDASGAVAVRGSANVKVFIDGKPSEFFGSSVADALKAIRGENIARVEVITHPSVRYDAEGTDAVINIITKKQNNNATSGKLALMPGNRSANISGDVQSRYNRWSAQADAFYQWYWNRNGSELIRQSAKLGFLQQTESRQKGGYFYGGMSISYGFDSLHTVTAGYRSRFSSSHTHSSISNFGLVDQSAVFSFLRKLQTPVSFRANTISLAYTGISRDRKKELSAMAMYFGGYGTNDYDLQQYYDDDDLPYREQLESISWNRDFIAEINYTRHIHKKWKLETGGKTTGKSLNSENTFAVYDHTTGTYGSDDQRSNVFRYNNTIYAAYANLSVNFKKWGFSTGMRYERTILNALFKDTTLALAPFNNWVPQVLISRMFGDKQSLKFGYTTRLVRPYVSYLNPTPVSNDSLNVQVGNPYLQPENIHRFQLSYTASYTKLFTDLALFFNNNRNSIEQVREPVADGVFRNTWKNIGSNRRLGLSASFTWKPSASFNIGGTLTTQYVWLNSGDMNIRNEGLMKQLVLRSTYTFSKGYSIYFYGFFDGSNLALQGKRTGWKYYSMTLSKKWKEDRFELNLRMDAFLTRYTWITERIATGDFDQSLRTRYQNQNFRLTFSWKIGKKEVKPVQARQAEREE